MNERRKSKRMAMVDSSMICRVNNSGMDISRIFDISTGGVGFLTRNDVSVGQTMSFRFFLPKKNGKDVSGVGQVVWAANFKDVFGDSVTRCGLQFKDLNPESAPTIKHYVNMAVAEAAV